MSEYRLCYEVTAKQPYYLSVIGVNLFSAEELCYFFYHNPELIDDTVLEPGLCDWVREELELTEVGRAMERAIRDTRGVEESVLPLFRKIGYLTYPQMQVYVRTLHELERLNETERLKRKADALVEYGIEGGAIRVYRKLLEDLPEDLPITASIYANLGTAHLYLLQYEEGIAALKKAAELAPGDVHRKAYVRAVAVSSTKEEFTEFCKREEVPASLKEKIESEIAEIRSQVGIKEVEPRTELDLLTQAYHKSMDL